MTEYAEQSLEVTLSGFPATLAHLILQPTLREPDITERLNMRDKMLETQEVLVNPWARPGQRAIGAVRVPNLYNGFGLVVTPKWK